MKPRKCKNGHTVDANNRIWRRDNRRLHGGYWSCAECYEKSKEKERERVRKTPKPRNIPPAETERDREKLNVFLNRIHKTRLAVEKRHRRPIYAGRA